MNKADAKLFEKKLNEINTEQLENELKKVAAIRNIEIFRRVTGNDMAFKGRLLVEVEQRNPIVRFMNGQDDFYMDREGVRIPASSQFTAKVLLANGQFDEKYARQQLLPLVIFIEENEFWKAQIEQLQVSPNGEIVMAPLVGDQLIEFGDAKNYRQKLQNLKALYEQAFPKTGWDYYSKINVKYTNQVVCTKK
jgi:cell division protein FtsQ